MPHSTNSLPSPSQSQLSNQNPFLLAADASQNLLPLLQQNPHLASSQDSHGYSLLHALVSYNHLELLRSLVSTFHPDPNLLDEDGETALFVAETVEAARTLIEDVGVDSGIRNEERKTAEEKIREEGDFVAVADYLRETRMRGGAAARREADVIVANPPPLPEGVRLSVGTMADEPAGGEVDEGFRRRIEELASKEDFGGEESQRELRELVKDAVREVGGEEREVRRRVGE